MRARVRLLEMAKEPRGSFSGHDRVSETRSEITSIDAALTDPHLLGAALGDAASWTTWLAVLRAAYGLTLNDEQQQFSEVAGGRNPPTQRVRELWAILARRSGKSRMAAALAVYIAVFTQQRLAVGEQGTVLVLAASHHHCCSASGRPAGRYQCPAPPTHRDRQHQSDRGASGAAGPACGRDITSDALAELIVEAQSAIAQAEQAAESERARALNPALSPDPAKARAAMEDAAFAADRLRTLLPKLQAKYQQVAAHEVYAEWAATFDALKPKHAAAAARLKQVYTEFEAQLVEVLSEAKQIDQEVHRVAYAKPYHLWESNNDGRNLPTVEAAACGLPGVNPDFSLMTMRLPAFEKPNALVWPPYEVPLALQVFASRVPVAIDPRQFTDEWWRVRQECAAAARAQALREQQERQAEADANFHGPRWWERTPS